MSASAASLLYSYLFLLHFLLFVVDELLLYSTPILPPSPQWQASNLLCYTGIVNTMLPPDLYIAFNRTSAQATETFRSGRLLLLSCTNIISAPNLCTTRSTCYRGRFGNPAWGNQACKELRSMCCLQVGLQTPLLRSKRGWGPTAQAFLKRLSKVTANRDGRDALTVFNDIAARISLTLAKGMGAMLVKGTS